MHTLPLIAASGLWCGYIILTDIILNFNNQINNLNYFDYTILIPFFIFLLSIPSYIFNIKTIKPNFKIAIFNTKILDDYFINESKTSYNIVGISKFLWICNIIFGVFLSILGIIATISVIESFPINELPHGLVGYLMCLGLLFVGFSITIDVIFLLRLRNKLYKKLLISID